MYAPSGEKATPQFLVGTGVAGSLTLVPKLPVQGYTKKYGETTDVVEQAMYAPSGEKATAVTAFVGSVAGLLTFVPKLPVQGYTET